MSDGETIIIPGLIDSTTAINFQAISHYAEHHDQRPTKRIKLESPISERGHDLETVTLWDLALQYDVSFLSPELEICNCDYDFPDFYVVNQSAPRTRTSRQQKKVYISRALSCEFPLVVVDPPPLNTEDAAFDLLNCLVALTTENGAFQKKLVAAYGKETYLTRRLSIRGCDLTLRFSARTKALLTATAQSTYLARDPQFKSLLNAYYSERFARPASVQSFYDSLYPPPVIGPTWIPVEGLKTELMHYQKNAVEWMLQREQGASQQPSLWVSYTKETGRVTFLQKTLGLICASEELVSHPTNLVLGGLLCDEMGLGKTLEVIATVLRNQRHDFDNDIKYDTFTGNAVRPIATTLVVTPISILRQWLDEIAKHSTLRAFHYTGTIAGKKDSIDLSRYDIVLTSYSVLSAEMWQVVPTGTDRVLRSPAQYERKLSPLISYEFWRVVMDEAQMIQSGFNAAAKVACLIPRNISWIVTGTPISTTCKDLFGLLHFLRIHPIYDNPHLWNKFLESDMAADQVANLFNPISCRNTKAIASGEIDIAKQTKLLCEINLTRLEEQNFRDLLSWAFEDLGLDHNGLPLDDDWAKVDLVKLQSWLLQIRQACSHPRIGGRNNRILNVTGQSVQSLDEVLTSMVEATRRDLEANRRAYFAAQIHKGQIKEYLDLKQDALAIWGEILPDIQEAVTSNGDSVRSAKAILDERDTDTQEAQETLVIEKNYMAALQQLRHWRETLHKCYFFLGSMSFQLKLEVDETRYYAKAKEIRSALLSEPESKAMLKISQLRQTAGQQNFVSIPEIQYPHQSGGFLTRQILEKLQVLTEMLNSQANQLDVWRELCIERLSASLADQNDDPSGEEYQKSLDFQEEAFSYHELIRFVVNDRHLMVNGEVNNLMRSDINKAMANTNELSIIMQNGLKIREGLIPADWSDSLVSIRYQLRNKMRAADSMRATNRDTTSANMEFEVVKRAIQELDRQFGPQKEAVEKLEKEVERLRDVYNARLEYYRQFQAVSDGVQEFTVLRRPPARKLGEMLDETLERALGRREKKFELEESDITDSERGIRAAAALFKSESDIRRLKSTIDAGSTRTRYLDFLGQDHSGTPPVCLICTDVIHLGAFTICGHIFCRDCFLQWFRGHRACPICKTYLHSNSFQTITLGPREKRSTKNDSPKDNASHSTKPMDAEPVNIQAAYEKLDEDMQREIDSVPIKRSYSSKVDSIIRHILYLPRGTKSILYSNWPEMLKVFHWALKENGIDSGELETRSNKSVSVNLSAFKHDPSFQVLLMSGKSQSAGLTLINATHLFLVEPILSPAIEQQICSRIHRIGQTKPTFCYQFVVSGTVEESIIKQSIARKQRELQNRAIGYGSGQVSENIPSKNADLPTAEEAVYLFKGNLNRRENREELLGGTRLGLDP